MTPIACPCCGYGTLPERNAYEICKICWWHDDGQDSAEADEVKGGPNYELSLTQGRLNFIEKGICCPNRKDLKKNSADRSKYKQMRFFSKSPDGKVVER
jgi:hypothetical protein